MQSILICDDDPDLRSTLKRTLRGYDVVEAACAREAMALLKKRSFDALLSDFNLGAEYDGLDLLQHARLSQPEIVRFLITGDRDLAIATRAVNEGSVHRYFLKPWNDEMLRVALSLVLRMKVRP